MSMITVLSILATAFLLLYFLLLLIYRYAWIRIPTYSEKQNEKRLQTYLSVIIPCRNEEQHIGLLIQSILKQTYPTRLYEIIVVDDFSTDNTVEVVNNFDLPNIKVISLKDEFEENDTINSYKKRAIERAIERAKGELIITTDADCIVQANWLKTIASFYETHQPAMIVMPVSICPTSSFIQVFQSLDFICLQGITGASVYKKLHGMCNGANLAYTKIAFNQVNGFATIDDIASGDDMMLLQKMARSNVGEIMYMKSKDVIVETLPVNNVRDFLQQRIRWASKADKYQDKSLFPVLLLVYLINLGLLATFLIGFFYPLFLTAFFICLIAKISFELYFLYPVADFFNQKKLLLFFPFLQPVHIVYTIVAGWLGKFSTYQWKGRLVR